MCGRLSLVKKKERGLFEEDVVVVIKNTRHLSFSSSSSHFLLFFFCLFSFALSKNKNRLCDTF